MLPGTVPRASQIIGLSVFQRNGKRLWGIPDDWLVP